MESIIYKDLYIMKDLFGGFWIRTLKFLKGTFLTIRTKRNSPFTSTLYHVRTQNSEQTQQNFSSPPVCNTEICFPLTFLPKQTTTAKVYIQQSNHQSLFQTMAIKAKLNSNQLKLFLQMRHLSARPFSWREGGRRLLSIWTS